MLAASMRVQKHVDEEKNATVKTDDHHEIYQTRCGLVSDRVRFAGHHLSTNKSVLGPLEIYLKL